jgi:hypothetical protein
MAYCIQDLSPKTSAEYRVKTARDNVYIHTDASPGQRSDSPLALWQVRRRCDALSNPRRAMQAMSRLYLGPSLVVAQTRLMVPLHIVANAKNLCEPKHWKLIQKFYAYYILVYTIIMYNCTHTSSSIRYYRLVHTYVIRSSMVYVSDR